MLMKCEFVTVVKMPSQLAILVATPCELRSVSRYQYFRGILAPPSALVLALKFKRKHNPEDQYGHEC
jgi:hypothetical protein